MLDGVSLDQLRAFIATVDERSFSAAARKLGRAQSVVSELVRGLELQLGVTLFDRSGRYPHLTSTGIVLLAHARDVVSGINMMKSRAKGIAAGLEPELSVVIDVFFPIHAIAVVAGEFRARFPNVPLRLYVEALGGAYLPLLDRCASFGIVASLPDIPPGIVTEPLTGIAFVTVAAADHPLAAEDGVIPRGKLAKQVQLVLTDRTELSQGRDFGVMSPETWRIADLFAKHAFLLNGLGWGNMPLHAVAAEIEGGRLVELKIEDMPAGGFKMPMFVAYRSDNPPGPAGRWLAERLKTGAVGALSGGGAASS